MSLYFFNVNDELNFSADDGQEIATLSEAKREALRYASALIGDMGTDFWLGKDWRMTVSDATGLALFTLLFAGFESASSLPRLNDLALVT
jgi:hypothetical protein